MKILTSRIAVATAISFAVAASPALAETAEDTETSAEADEQSERQIAREEAAAEDPHYRGDILVSADGLEELDFIAGQDVIGLDEIQRDLSGQIGELLVKIPGVSATSFAPGSSRPILRGLDAERVRVLIDGVGTADVGNTSADHATTIDPLTTTRVEVLRGPTALLYGSQAIGGVVNAIDRRIPIEVPENGVHFDALTAFDTVSDLRSGGASIDVAVGESVVFHLDGSFRETNDLEISGFQLSPELRAELLEEAAEEEAEGEFEEAAEIREAAGQTEFIPNSATETWTVNGGVGFFFGDSSIGASVGYFDTDYGVVGRPGAEHAHGEEEGEEEEEEGEEEEIVTIGLEQLRVDFRGDFGLGDGFLSRLKVRGVYSDYEHTEFEGAEVGTVFDTETVEIRAELLQREGGVIGAQFVSRDFEAVGEEAFVAPNETTSFAIFTAQELDFDGFQIEGAARYENVDVESDVFGVDRNFDLFSGALSFVAVPGDGDVRLGVTGSRSERAPAGEELFSDGPHIATQAFEIGDPTFDEESAWGLEAFARGNIGAVQFSASVYAQWFDDFIFLQPNGEEEDDLPVFLFLQDDANFFGFEGQVTFPLFQSDTFGLNADLRAEYVEAELDNDDNLPRIPPLSLLGALDAEFGQFDVRGEVQWFAEQDEITDFETPTDDFAFVNLYISWRPLENNQNVVLQLAGENLFDTTGRRHSSFTKDFVPLPGQNIRASVRLSF
ncbi:TonB-dependent receptor [Erythrobacter rubeus]|uniref:TonB-dependent receptor n=1 Tax=Erythrobacter rubeus TaxID=2760803 RepID=A0ABR8KWW5_9SPHN|nr:TonB-dependent receptor [Erythrobacter rubeus]MBD2842914.1 TonB-dependent receptor [Erythrobacter rubeus]